MDVVHSCLMFFVRSPAGREISGVLFILFFLCICSIVTFKIQLPCPTIIPSKT